MTSTNESTNKVVIQKEDDDNLEISIIETKGNANGILNGISSIELNASPVSSMVSGTGDATGTGTDDETKYETPIEGGGESVVVDGSERVDEMEKRGGIERNENVPNSEENVPNGEENVPNSEIRETKKLDIVDSTKEEEESGINGIVTMIEETDLKNSTRLVSNTFKDSSEDVLNSPPIPSSLTQITTKETIETLVSPHGNQPVIDDYIQPRFTTRSPASSSHSKRQSMGVNVQRESVMDLKETEEMEMEMEMDQVDLDDISLDGNDVGQSSSSSSSSMEKKPSRSSTGAGASAGLFGRGLGFLQSTSSGSTSIPIGNTTIPVSHMTRSSSSSSAFSMAGGVISSGTLPPPPPPPPPSQPRSVSSTWKNGWNALLGGTTASSSSPLSIDTAGSPIKSSSSPITAEYSPRDAAISGTLLSLNTSVHRPSNRTSLSQKRVSKAINGESENAARRDSAFESENSVRAEDFGEGSSDDEDYDVGSDGGGAGRMSKAKRRMKRRDSEEEEDAVEDGVVGGVDWSFWGAVMNDYEEVARRRPKDLSRSIQQGIPAVIRGTMWQLMSSSKSPDLEAKYSALLKLHSKHEKSIEKDIARTFPGHAYFQQAGGVGQENLFNVVKAYSLCDPEVGYTQGLAFIVAPLLLLMPEEEAFCVLVRLMESYDLRSHFLPEMPGLQLRLYQFDRLVEELLPVLHLRFVRIGIKSSMYASQWFMTMFSYRFPLSLVFRIYDIVFAEGVEAVFRFSLALLQINEEHLLKLDFEDCLRFLQAGLFDAYKQTEQPDEDDLIEEDHLGQGDWKANEFVVDAYRMRISTFMLDSYAGEHIERCKALNAHAIEVDTLRNANRNLSSQVKRQEAALATMNNEHVDLVRELVQSRIEKEEIETELVRYKMLYAELSHAQQEASASIPTQRLSNGSTTRKLGLWA